MTGESILIVEDEGLIALHITELLEKTGYMVSNLSSGEAVLRDIGISLRPDLILMDIALAGSLDGIETARLIRSKYDIPVIFLTAYSDPDRVERAKTIPASGYLIKPVMDDELYATITKVLNNRRS